VLDLSLLKGNKMKQQVEQLLEEWHPNEIGRMVGLSDSEAKKIVREIYFDWGYTSRKDWVAVEIGDGEYVLCLEQGDEWIDEDGNYRCFDTRQKALDHLQESLKRWHLAIILKTHS
jgi:hypothetical protein